ncbi:telomere repeat binding factor-domain-containing protein, partial [Diplogelasinospora grovesii]
EAERPPPIKSEASVEITEPEEASQPAPVEAVAPPPPDATPAIPDFVLDHVPETAAPALFSPKRARSPGLLEEENSAKRVKTESVIGIDFNLQAMLQNALESYNSGATHAENAAVDHAHTNAEGEGKGEGDGSAHASSSATASPPPREREKMAEQQNVMKASSNSAYVLRSMSLPVLGNLAVQILLRISQQTRAETEALLHTEPDSEPSEFRKAYDLLKNLFELARRAFSDKDCPLLFPDDLDISDSDDRETIRMANLATIGLGVKEVGVTDVHDNLWSIFLQEDGEYKATLTALVVSLKTQALLESWEDGDGEAQQRRGSELLDRHFPVDFEETLKLRTGDFVLNSDELGLVKQVKQRRELILGCLGEEQPRTSVENLFSFESLPEEISLFLQGHLGVIVDYAEKYGVNIPLGEEPVTTNNAHFENHHDTGHDDIAALLASATSGIFQNHTDEPKESHAEAPRPEEPSSSAEDYDLSKLLQATLTEHGLEAKDEPVDQPATNGTGGFDAKDFELASLIAEKLADVGEAVPDDLANHSTTPYSPTVQDTNHAAVHPSYLAQLNQTQTSSPYVSYPQAAAPQVSAATGEMLPPNQSSPTSVLYERARQAAVAKSSTAARREGLHSTRRPWTPEEEKALMAGLDMVKGPHWSQILSLFGANGTISDILKDRTQVQLKDKARNLKLFFLKTNSEMPFYLQSVTGELKTRAPSQAARKEAEEKARLNSEEEQARIQSIMMLASGLQNRPLASAMNPVRTPTSPYASPHTPGVGIPHTGVNTTSVQTSTNGAVLAAPVPISPLVKSEPADHHAVSHISSLPNIQPAPAYKSQLAPQPPRQQPMQQPQQQTQQRQQQYTQQHTQQHAQQQVQQHQQQQQQQQRQQPQQQVQNHTSPQKSQAQPQQYSSPQKPQLTLPQQRIQSPQQHVQHTVQHTVQSPQQQSPQK